MAKQPCPSNYDPEEWDEMCERFADPGGDSVLWPESKDNPRNLSCPDCDKPNRLTRKDRQSGYHCDECTRLTEMGI